MFELYPRHGHRTPQQIAEDTGGAFEPTRPRRHIEEDDGGSNSMRGAANDSGMPAAPARHLDVPQPR